jgi:hypothetical protein
MHDYYREWLEFFSHFLCLTALAGMTTPFRDTENDQEDWPEDSS